MIRYAVMASSVLAIGLAGCGKTKTGTHLQSHPTALETPSSTASLPSVILSSVSPPEGEHERVYEDADYSFWTRNHVSKGQYVPGVFVLSRKTQKWMRVDRVATKNARLGRSPTFEEGMCSVGWDYSTLRNKAYAVLPLMTSGSVNLPDKITYDPGPQEYHLLHNCDWGIPAVLTELVFKKGDLDAAFAAARGNPAGG